MPRPITNVKEKEEVCKLRYGEKRFSSTQLQIEFSEVSMRLKEGDYSDNEDKKNWEEQLECMKIVNPNLKPLEWKNGKWVDEHGQAIGQ